MLRFEAWHSTLGGSAYSRARGDLGLPQAAGEALFPLVEVGRAKARAVVMETSDFKGSWPYWF